MYRFVLLGCVLLAISACGRSSASGPKWPAPSTTADDGGESVDPRPSATYAAAIEKSAEPDEPAPAASTTAAAVPASEDKPAAATEPVPTLTEEVFTTEEIVIEIED